jgi:hypothetical protein
VRITSLISVTFRAQVSHSGREPGLTSWASCPMTKQQESEDNSSIRSGSAGFVMGTTHCPPCRAFLLRRLAFPTDLITCTQTRAFTVTHHFIFYLTLHPGLPSARSTASGSLPHGTTPSSFGTGTPIWEGHILYLSRCTRTAWSRDGSTGLPTNPTRVLANRSGAANRSSNLSPQRSNM